MSPSQARESRRRQRALARAVRAGQAHRRAASASSASPTSSSWRRTRIRSARARWRSPPCSGALADTWLYPDGSGHALKQKLAAKLGVGTDQITLGNGSNDAAGAAGRGLPEARARSRLFAVRASRCIRSPSRPPAPPASWCRRLPAGFDRCRSATTSPPWRARSRRRTRVVFIANPNNPTGTWVPAPRSSRRSSRQCRAHVIVALDEAYFEYTGGLDSAGRRSRGWHEIPESRGVPHVLEGVWTGRRARRLCASAIRPWPTCSIACARRSTCPCVALAGAAAALDDPGPVRGRGQGGGGGAERVATRLEQSGTTVPSAGRYDFSGDWRRFATVNHRRGRRVPDVGTARTATTAGR